MVKKRSAQVSIFVILAIIIFAVLAAIILIKVNPTGEKISKDIQPIYNSVEECLSSTGKDALNVIGWSGGYATIPNSSTETGIAYYYDNGKTSIPLKKIIESELSNYIDNMGIYCSQSLENFPDFIITSGIPKTKTRIEGNKVIFTINYPLSISRGGKSYSVKNFGIEIDSRLSEIHDLAANITQEQVIDGNKICVTCLNTKANEGDFYIEINDYDDQTKIITIKDKQYPITEEYYRFNIAYKFKS